MHCSRRRLLRRGQEFHVCTINKSAHTKKVWKLILLSSYIRVVNEYFESNTFSSPRGIMAKELDCGFEVSEFELQSCYYVHFRTNTLGKILEEQGELISDDLQWTPSHQRASVGRPARTYLQQLCTDTGSILETQPEAIDDERELEKSLRAAWSYDVKSVLVNEAHTNGSPNSGQIASRPFGWAIWHSCWMGDRNQKQTRGRIGPQLRLGNLRVGELLFRPLV